MREEEKKKSGEGKEKDLHSYFAARPLTDCYSEGHSSLAFKKLANVYCKEEEKTFYLYITY